MLSWPKKFLIAFGLGVMAFTPWEILMVSLGVVEFPRANFWGLPWWTPVAFGLVTTVSFFLFALVDHVLKLKVHYNPNWLALEYLLISGFYLAVFFFRQYPYILSLSLLFVVIVRLIFFHESLDIVFFIFGISLGPTVELVLTNFDLYHFTEPDFMGTPYWLPVFWGNVALALRRVSWVLAPPRAPEHNPEVDLKTLWFLIAIFGGLWWSQWQTLWRLLNWL